MSAYVLSEVTTRDATAVDRYRELAAASIACHGGRYLARGTVAEVAEGRWPEEARLVLVEFPDLGAVHDWYASPEYRPALEVRDAALERRLLFFDGAARGAG
jgi:uncharacterized protein (DUF1330 family)